MRDYLNRFTQIVAVTFFGQHIPVHLASGQVGKFVEVFVNKPFIMAQIQVGFSAVFRDEHLPMLIRAYRAGIYIDIRIQLLGGDLQPSGFEQAAQRGCSNALAQTGYNAAGYKDVFGHHFHSFP